MPPVRQRRNFSHISDFDRGRIIGMKEAGLSFREIGRRLNRDHTTVARIWSAWSEEGIQQHRPAGRPPRRSNLREDRLLRRMATQDRFQTTRSIAVDWTRAMDRHVSMSTIYRRIASFGLHAYRPNRRLPLTAPQKAARLAWCQERRNWVDEWNHIVFSDESRFCLWQNDGRRRVRRYRGERRNLQLAERRHTALTPGVMVWGAICLGQRSPLVFIPGTLNAHRYINNVLEPVAVPFMQTLPNGIFQQDNARPHMANITRRFLEEAELQILPWPARSPDLSPIEHVWDMIGRRLRNLPRPPDNLDDLRHQVQVAWDEIPQQDIDHLLESMPRRVNACITVQSDVTHY